MRRILAIALLCVAFCASSFAKLADMLLNFTGSFSRLKLPANEHLCKVLEMSVKGNGAFRQFGQLFNPRAHRDEVRSLHSFLGRDDAFLKGASRHGEFGCSPRDRTCRFISTKQSRPVLWFSR